MVIARGVSDRHYHVDQTEEEDEVPGVCYEELGLGCIHVNLVLQERDTF